MRARFWNIDQDSRFDYEKHYEMSVYDDAGNLVREERLTEEGSKLARLIDEEKLKDWTNDVKWFPWGAQGKYVIAVAPDQLRHAMARVELRPTLLVASYRALCGAEHQENKWTLMVDTHKDTVYLTGAINCDYCLGCLVFEED